ncbi:MAG TPA: hypothetical protein DDX85_05555 [Nitrospiraceae bacterium]|nr:hypothetical protein [Nitrospiraceae bacterium]
MVREGFFCFWRGVEASNSSSPIFAGEQRIGDQYKRLLAAVQGPWDQGSFLDIKGLLIYRPWQDLKHFLDHRTYCWNKGGEKWRRGDPNMILHH